MSSRKIEFFDGFLSETTPSSTIPTGPQGSSILQGTIDPTTEGEDGDTYINTTSGEVFEKDSGSWASTGDLTGPAGAGMSAGGTSGQVLVKDTGTDYDTSWVDNAPADGTVTNAKIDASANIEMSKLEALTASRAVETDGSGELIPSAVTNTELNYLDGVTSAIQTQIDSKLNSTGGTISSNLTVSGNLTVNGTTTTLNTATLEIEDANITLNEGGNQSSAGAAAAGITIEMSDATDVRIGYDSTLASKFKIGDVGSESEIVDVDSSQTCTNKTIDADNNTISNIGDEELKAGIDSAKLANGTVSNAEFQYLNGVTSDIQTQINSALTNPMDGNGQLIYGAGSGVATKLAAGTSGQVLQSNGASAPSWTTPAGGVSVTAVSSNITLAAGDIYLVDTSSSRSLTLPSPSSGDKLTIKDKTGQANTNNITVIRAGSEDIEGVGASRILQTNWGAWTFASDGTDWYIING